MLDAVAALRGRSLPGLRIAAGAVAVAVGLGGVSAVASPVLAPGSFAVLLSSNVSEGLAGSERALIMGPSMMPTPKAEYAEAVDTLYLRPHGFAGQLEVLTAPASPYQLDNSLAAGTTILVDRVQELIGDGRVDAEHPLTIFGYSQSAAMTTYAMQQLHEADVPSQYLRFVLIGDSAHPNGGALVAFEDAAGVKLADDIPMGNATPNDLYPTVSYAMEYDGYADFPRYPMHLLSSLNAVMGMFTQHLAYLGVTPEQVAEATLLESSPDSLFDSYMIPSEYLPLLWPVLFVPVVGKPLYELMEPTMRILANMGYGNLEHGWNDGPADVPTKVSMDLPPIDPGELSAALAKGAQDGWDAFMAALVDPETYQYADLLEIPALSGLVTAATSAIGATAADNLTAQQLVGGLFDMVWPSLAGEGLILG